MAGTGRLTNPQIVRLASIIPARVMKPIAEGFMDISAETLVNLEDTHRSDVHAFSREVIRTWSYRNSGNDQIEKLALLLFQAATMDGISLNTVKISEILGVAEEQVLGGSVSSATGTGSSAQQTRAAMSGASGQPGGTTGTRPSLTADMIVKLSRRITGKTDLKKLGISGLKMEGFEVDGFIQRNVHEGITAAADEMLNAWRVDVGDDEEAYQRLWDALGSKEVKMALYRQTLK